MAEDHDLDDAIARVQAATIEFVNGRPEDWMAICSHRADATLFGGWGGHERGWEELAPRYVWAAARFAGGEVTFEELSRFVSADLASTVHVEHSRARLTGIEQSVSIALRVTNVYRREETGWKLAHHHSDPLVAVQPPETVVAR